MTKEEIKALRYALCMTQFQFAEHLGVTIAAVSRWENGHAIPTNAIMKILNNLSKTFISQLP